MKKLVFVGDEGIGKTSLIHGLLGLPIPKEHIPTIEDLYPRKKFGLMDTAGASAFDRMRPTAYQGAVLIILCFGLDNMSSLDHIIEKWIPEAQYYSQCPQILVGTRKDVKCIQVVY